MRAQRKQPSKVLVGGAGERERERVYRSRRTVYGREREKREKYIRKRKKRESERVCIYIRDKNKTVCE